MSPYSVPVDEFKRSLREPELAEVCPMAELEGMGPLFGATDVESGDIFYPVKDGMLDPDAAFFPVSGQRPPKDATHFLRIWA